MIKSPPLIMRSSPRQVYHLVELDGLPPRWDARGEAQLLHLRLERSLRRGIAVDDERRPRLLREVPKPREELRLVRVRGEAADRADLAADLLVGSVDVHRLRALL